MNTLLYCFILSFLVPDITPHSDTITIPLPGSAYAHPDDETRVYFLATHTGQLQVQLKGRASQATTVLVRLDGKASKDTTIRVGESGGDAMIDAGSFEVDATGYHFISLKPAGGGHLPEMGD